MEPQNMFKIENEPSTALKVHMKFTKTGFYIVVMKVNMVNFNLGWSFTFSAVFAPDFSSFNLVFQGFLDNFDILAAVFITLRCFV